MPALMQVYILIKPMLIRMFRKQIIKGCSCISCISVLPRYLKQFGVAVDFQINTIVEACIPIHSSFFIYLLVVTLAASLIVEHTCCLSRSPGLLCLGPHLRHFSRAVLQAPCLVCADSLSCERAGCLNCTLLRNRAKTFGHSAVHACLWSALGKTCEECLCINNR